MITITIKNLPEKLHQELKRSAELHRRSLNSEIIERLEVQLTPRKADVQARVEATRRLRERLAPVPHKLVDAMKRQGRP